MGKSLYGKVLSKFEDYMNSQRGAPPSEDAEVGNKILTELIRGGAPFLAGRLGTTENNTLSWYEKFNKIWGLPFAKDLREGSWMASGLFPPTSAVLRRWSQLCEEALSLSDVYCSWGLSMDGYFRTHQLRSSRFVSLATLEAHTLKRPWTLELEGKRVLIVHPFAETIQSQYANHRLGVFPGREVLPEFTLMTVKAPQTIAGNTGGYRSWAEAFDQTCSKIATKDFDIALIGAGSYGMPLCGFVRKSGKAAIYVGGVLQVFFGIKGARWDGQGLYNDAWVSPQAEDRPANFQTVEQGCYW